MPWYLDKIDTDTTGNRDDVTPLFADASAFNALVHDLVEALGERKPDRIAGIDALGFILGTAVARELHLGFVPIRKGGKLPVPARSEGFVDYSGSNKRLELRLDAVQAGDQIVIVDEWIETGAQVAAAIRLIEASGGTVLGILTIHMDEKAATQELAEKYTVVSASRL